VNGSLNLKSGISFAHDVYIKWRLKKNSLAAIGQSVINQERCGAGCGS
jgi:hypothetical protein